MKTKYIFPVIRRTDEMYKTSQEHYLKERARFWNISEDCVPEVMRLIDEGVPLKSEAAIELYERLNFGFGSIDAHGITLQGDGYEYVSKKEPEDWFLLEQIIKSLREQETATEEQIAAVEGFYTNIQGSDVPKAHT